MSSALRLSNSILGVTVGPIQHDIDAEWLSSYASGLGESAKRNSGDLEAHPVFPACYEWPVLLAMRGDTIPETVYLKGVHATYDMTIHRLPRSGERLSTTATVTAVRARKPGAYVLTRLWTVDQKGEPVTTTDYGTLYLGVDVVGDLAAGSETNVEGREGSGQVQHQSPTFAWQVQVPVARDHAHVYSECSRIWNPIHTDRAVAMRAGLPDTILHGTATLALAVSKVLETEGEPPGRVCRIACRFGGMVFMPSTVLVQGSRSSSECHFQALNREGRPAVDRGLLSLSPERTP